MMNNRDIANRNNYENNAEMIKMAKEKLQWYTMEATDEEFDVEAVDALVNIISVLEKQAETVLEANSLQEDEAIEILVETYNLRVQEQHNVGVETEAEVMIPFYKRVMKYPDRRWAGVIVAACLVVLLLVVSSFGVVNAGINQGFFQWLKRDEEGIKLVTSPEQNNLAAERHINTQYEAVTDIPERYCIYVVEKNSIPLLAGYETEYHEIYETVTFDKVSTLFSKEDGKTNVKLGVLIYDEKIDVTWEKYDAHDDVYTNEYEDGMQDIMKKQDALGEMEYSVFFYKDNKKYFVIGDIPEDELESIAEEYMSYIFDLEE